MVTAMGSPDTTNRIRQRPQVSLQLMLMMMVIFAVMSAGLFYATRVAAIQTELSILTGARFDGVTANRKTQLIFLMFTYTSPLLLAMLFGAIVATYRKLGITQGHREARRGPWHKTS